MVDPLGRGLWVIDEENDEVALMLPSGTSRRFAVGRWPQQLVASSAGRIFVSCRQDGRLDVIDPDNRQQQIEVGDEPRALALDEDHNRIYVGLVTGKAIVALDTRTLNAVARTEVPDRPVAIAITAAGLVVASDRSLAVRFFDPQLKEQTRQVDLPAQHAATLTARLLVPAGDGVLLIAERARTGLDQPVSSGGYGGEQSSDPIDTLLINLGQLDRGYSPATVLAAIAASEPVAAFYRDEVLYVASRGRGSVVTLGLSLETGAVSTPVELRPSLWKFVADQDSELRRYADGNGDPLLLQPDLTGLVADELGRLVVTDALGRRLLHLAAPSGPRVLRQVGRRMRLLELMNRPSTLSIASPQEGFGNAFGALPLDDQRLNMILGSGGPGSGARPFGMAASQTSVVPVLVQNLAPGRDAELRVGQQLFHASQDFRVSAHGVACASCHPDGREDGRVWSLIGTRRQTPMLTGRLHDTAPFNWLGTATTLEGNLRQTMTERLEGQGLEGRELKALTRFVRDGLRPFTRPPPKEPELVSMGRDLFTDATVGCAACHPVDFETTDGERHDVGSLSTVERREFRFAHPPRFQLFDRKTMMQFAPIERALRLPSSRGIRVPGPTAPRRFDTPSLRAVALTAPYFHDGAAGSLEELIANNADRMGTTSHLDETQRRALVAYLQTL